MAVISRLDQSTTKTIYERFARQLEASEFSGDIELDYAERTVLSTDNSIYQLMPEGVIYPRSTEDISKLFILSATEEFRQIILSPRGGGTGTNGQSLTIGFMIDTSRYMNLVLEINVEERWARVQSGTVKDDLNEQAARAGLFFAPELSTSNRATIGGMVNTDASGQGSVIYGKTRHHVLELTSILPDGTIWRSFPIDNSELDQVCQRQDLVGNIHQKLKTVHEQHHEQVKEIFPKLNRNLTGYDLAHIFNSDDKFDLNAILCGSEGTLSMVSEVKVNLLPIPTHSALMLIFYKSFQESLQDAQFLMLAKPASIETVDSLVLSLARSDSVWRSVKDFFPEHLSDNSQANSNDVDGINFVEFTGNHEDEIQQGIDRLINELEKPTKLYRVGYQAVFGSANVKKIWNMRKKAVGLLGNMEGDARPIPFVEDVAVPPENLADFIQKFRALLDSHQLSYGMFGHVDAGVLHVRPAIDMKNQEQEKMVRIISNDVAALARQHGGVLWGEHGKGVRSEYAPDFFADLYPVLQEIKGTFDPYNQLNPGKIATPSSIHQSVELLRIDEVPTRGQYDRDIERQSFKAFASGMYCNGNGACFDFSVNSAMCPTWKATHNRIQSPKGRSGLVREWLRLQSVAGVDVASEVQKARYACGFINAGKKLVNKWRGEDDFSHAVYDALDSCMSCKSCAGQCPIQVNIPDLRSRYFEIYHSRYPRPVKHYIAGMLETMLPIMARFKPVWNWMMGWQLTHSLSSNTIGLTDLPKITSASPMNECCRAGATIASRSLINSIPVSDRKKTIVIVQDAFTSFFETPLLTDFVELLIRLGYRPLVAPFKPNGKVLHVYGYLGRFKKVANTNGKELKELADTGVSLVGIDAAVTLTYRDEYQEVMGDDSPGVLLMSEWFFKNSIDIQQLGIKLNGDFILLGHCTEISNVPASVTQWQQLFHDLGMSLNYQPTGCCGMSGIYGHESINQDASLKLYNLSWKEVVTKPENQGKLVATGYSCRSQVKRYSNGAIPHPIQVILRVLKKYQY